MWEFKMIFSRQKLTKTQFKRILFHNSKWQTFSLSPLNSTGIMQPINPLLLDRFYVIIKDNVVTNIYTHIFLFKCKFLMNSWIKWHVFEFLCILQNLLNLYSYYMYVYTRLSILLLVLGIVNPLTLSNLIRETFHLNVSCIYILLWGNYVSFPFFFPFLVSFLLSLRPVLSFSPFENSYATYIIIFLLNWNGTFILLDY